MNWLRFSIGTVIILSVFFAGGWPTWTNLLWRGLGVLIMSSAILAAKFLNKCKFKVISDLEAPLVSAERREDRRKRLASSVSFFLQMLLLALALVIGAYTLFPEPIHINFQDPAYDETCDTTSAKFDFEKERQRLSSPGKCTWSDISKPYNVDNDRSASGLVSWAGALNFLFSFGQVALPCVFQPDSIISSSKSDKEDVLEKGQIEDKLQRPATIRTFEMFYTKRVNALIFLLQIAFFLLQVGSQSWITRPFPWDVAMHDFSMTFRVQLLFPIILCIVKGYALASNILANFAGHLCFEGLVSWRVVVVCIIAILPWVIYLPAVLLVILLAEFFWLFLNHPCGTITFILFAPTVFVLFSYLQDIKYWWITGLCLISISFCCCAFGAVEFNAEKHDYYTSMRQSVMLRPFLTGQLNPPSDKKEKVQDILYILSLPGFAFLLSTFAKRTFCANAWLCTYGQVGLANVNLPQVWAGESFAIAFNGYVTLLILGVLILLGAYSLKFKPTDVSSKLFPLCSADVLWRLQYLGKVPVKRLFDVVHNLVDDSCTTPFVGACNASGTILHDEALKIMLKELGEYEETNEKVMIGGKGILNVESSSGYTALMAAIRNKNQQRVKVLLETSRHLELDIDVNQKCSLKDFDQPLSPVMLAVNVNNKEAVSQLILWKKDDFNQRCDLKSQSESEMSPILTAASLKEFEIVDELMTELERRGENIQCEFGSTSLLVSLVSLPRDAADRGSRLNIDLVKRCIEAGADLNWTKDNGGNQNTKPHTPLMLISQWFADYSGKELFKILVDARANLEKTCPRQEKGESNQTVLMNVARLNKVEMAKILLDGHAKQETEDSLERTAFDHAKYYRSKEVMKLLKKGWVHQEFQTSDLWKSNMNIAIIGEVAGGKSTWLNEFREVRTKIIPCNLNSAMKHFIAEQDNLGEPRLIVKDDFKDAEHDGPAFLKGWFLNDVLDANNAESYLAQHQGGGASEFHILNKLLEKAGNVDVKLHLSDAPAAAVGAGEVTLKAIPYQVSSKCQDMADFFGATFWDLPGCGTRRWSEETYVRKIGLKHFDLVILICGGTLSETNQKILIDLKDFEKKCLVVCSKADIDIENNKRDKGMNQKQAVEAIRKEFMRNQNMQVDEENVELFSKEHFFLACRAEEAERYEDVEQDVKKLRDEIKKSVKEWKEQHPEKQQKLEEGLQKLEEKLDTQRKIMKEQELRHLDEEIEKKQVELVKAKQRLVELVFKAEQKKLGKELPTDHIISRVQKVIVDIKDLQTRASGLLATANREKAQDRVLKLYEECVELEQLLLLQNTMCSIQEKGMRDWMLEAGENKNEVSTESDDFRAADICFIALQILTPAVRFKAAICNVEHLPPESLYCLATQIYHVDVQEASASGYRVYIPFTDETATLAQLVDPRMLQNHWVVLRYDDFTKEWTSVASEVNSTGMLATVPSFSPTVGGLKLEPVVLLALAAAAAVGYAVGRAHEKLVVESLWSERDVLCQWAFPWTEHLPGHIPSDLCTACVQFASEIAINGLDESRPHHGFAVIVGDYEHLQHCGESSFNPFDQKSKEFHLLDSNRFLDGKTVDLLRRLALHTDGAVVVDSFGRAKIAASHWFVKDCSLGGGSGGARSRSCRAVAKQAGGCFVLKCSEGTRELVMHLQELEEQVDCATVLSLRSSAL